jgi:hypothetical protein
MSCYHCEYDATIPYDHQHQEGDQYVHIKYEHMCLLHNLHEKHLDVFMDQIQEARISKLYGYVVNV